MACDNEYCDPEIGNDCAKCFARRYIKERKAKIMQTEQEQRQMNEDIGELLAALGTAYGYLTDGHIHSLNRVRGFWELHQKIGQSHRDRQSKFREYLLADSRRTALLKSANWLRFQASDHTMTDAESIELCKLASELTGMANGETAS